MNLVWNTSFSWVEVPQTSKTGDIGTAWSPLQLSSPVLRGPNVDANGFLLLSGARPTGLDLLGNTRAGIVGLCGIGVVGVL